MAPNVAVETQDFKVLRKSMLNQPTIEASAFTMHHAKRCTIAIHMLDG